MTLFSLGFFFASLTLSFVLTRYVRNSALEKGWITGRVSSRDVHATPLPRLGGVAIFLALHLTIAIAIFVGHWYPSIHFDISSIGLLRILGPGLLIFALGVYDDVHEVGPYPKFVVQIIAAVLLFAGGLRVFNLPILFGQHHFSWMLSLPLTILWVVAITNAFNLIDGLDGLAAGSALFSTIVVFIAAVASGSHFPLITLALAGAILGFLRFNFNPATIFLGDSGSLYIGFLLSALALEGAQKAPTIVAVAIPIVSFGLPILDTSLSILRRLISGKPVFAGDLEHIHHKLLQRGLSHRQVVILLYGVSAIFALLGLFLLAPGGGTVALVLTVLGIGVWMGVQHLGYLEFGEIRRVAQRTMEQRQVFMNNMALRRAAEELKVARDYAELCRVIQNAFCSNDVDGVDLIPRVHAEKGFADFASRNFSEIYKWRKSGVPPVDFLPSWNLKLDLVTRSNQSRGSLVVYRAYSQRALLLDVNILTSEFPIVLAEALDRTLWRVITIPDAAVIPREAERAAIVS